MSEDTVLKISEWIGNLAVLAMKACAFVASTLAVLWAFHIGNVSPHWIIALVLAALILPFSAVFIGFAIMFLWRIACGSEE